MSTKNGSTKYADTVARATGTEVATADEHAPSIPLSRGAQAMISKPSEAEIQDMMNDPDQEFAPQAKSMEEGELICGVLEGYGPDAELTRMDPLTKESVTQVVHTWIIAAPGGGLRVSILDTVQLAKKLPPFIGSSVKILRGKDTKTGNGFKVTNYMVSGPKRTDGKARSWARPLVIDAQSIDAPAAPQLAQGAPAYEGGEDAQA